MEYSFEFKQKVFNFLRFHPICTELLKHIENKKHNLVRQILEDLVDDNLLYDEEVKRDKLTKVVRENKINTWKQRNEIYSEFMELYINHLDNVGLLQE